MKTEKPKNSFFSKDKPLREKTSSENRPSRSDSRSSRDENRPSRSDSRSSRDENRPSRSDSRSSRDENRPSRSDSRSSRDENRPSRSDSRSSRDESRNQPKREYKPTERKPRHLRGDDKPKENPFTRQVFAGKSDSYSERLDSARKPKKSETRKNDPTKPKDPNAPIRLNRFIAQSGVCSRREADEIIESGEVTVNGVVVTELGSKVLFSDIVEYQGKALRGEKKVYIIMNKPKGYVTSVDDPHNDRTVIDLLKGDVSQRVYPVGRLDKMTTGVLLITNDGDLTKELTHPSYEKSKIYHVFLDQPITEEHLDEIVTGITLEDGEIKADEVSTVGSNKREVGLELHSGRNRIVRRIFEHLGYQVEKLDRVYFAGLTKVGLRRGFWRFLTEQEIAMLKSKNYR